MDLQTVFYILSVAYLIRVGCAPPPPPPPPLSPQKPKANNKPTPEDGFRKNAMVEELKKVHQAMAKKHVGDGETKGRIAAAVEEAKRKTQVAPPIKAPTVPPKITTPIVPATTTQTNASPKIPLTGPGTTTQPPATPTITTPLAPVTTTQPTAPPSAGAGPNPLQNSGDTDKNSKLIDYNRNLAEANKKLDEAKALLEVIAKNKHEVIDDKKEENIVPTKATEQKNKKEEEGFVAACKKNKGKIAIATLGTCALIGAGVGGWFYYNSRMHQLI